MFHVRTAAIAVAAACLLATLPAAAHSSEDKIKVLQTITGSASWYGSRFQGRKTANGERFDMHQLTAAHRTLPFGTKVRVTNRNNGKSVVVRINDRGPYSGNRIIDLSRSAAKAVGMISQGVASVKLEVF